MLATISTTSSSVGFTSSYGIAPSSGQVTPSSLDALSCWEAYEEEPDDAKLCLFLDLDELYPEVSLSSSSNYLYLEKYAPDQTPAMPVTATGVLQRGPSPSQVPSTPNPLAPTFANTAYLGDKTISRNKTNSPVQPLYSPTSSFVVSSTSSTCISLDEASVSASPCESEMRPKKRQRRSNKKIAKKKEDIDLCQRLRNREHARQSRLRKKMARQSLEEIIPNLQEENKRLRHQIYAIIGKAETDRAVKALLTRRQRSLVETLKKEEHRIVNKYTLDFLQSLRKDALVFVG